MTRRFVLRARAERDIQSAFEWYESQQRGLGDQFLASLRERLAAVRTYP
jgi:plasmid stabilization system protein ParE